MHQELLFAAKEGAVGDLTQMACTSSIDHLRHERQGSELVCQSIL